MLKLEDGSVKRVPHRVYEIYQAIKQNHTNTINPLNPQELWQNIEMFAQKALKHPRPGRDKNTTEFYNNIVNGNSVPNKKPLNQYVPNEMAPVPSF